MKRVCVLNDVEKNRKALGMTQETLAEHVHVTRQTIISIEKGNYIPSVLLAMQLARAFKRPLEEVFSYED